MNIVKKLNSFKINNLDINYDLLKNNSKFKFKLVKDTTLIKDKPLLNKRIVNDYNYNFDNEDLNIFFRRLFEFTNLDYNILKSKIKKLKYRIGSNFSLYDKMLFKLNPDVRGYNTSKKCLIVIKDEKYKKTIYHELLHFVSSIYKDKKIYAGFNQVFNDYDIGEGLNEGYTEYLCLQMFGMSDTYIVEKDISSIIELIIGRNKMLEYYFNADLKSLLKDLSYIYNKNTEIDKDILELIIDIDIIHKLCFRKEERNPNFNFELQKLFIKVGNKLLVLFRNSIEGLDEKEQTIRLCKFTNLFLKNYYFEHTLFEKDNQFDLFHYKEDLKLKYNLHD